MNALCADAGLAFETARRYLEILEDTLLLFRVPAFAGSDRSSFLQHPKIYLFDLGVRNALLRRSLLGPSEDERGLLLEHLVGCELARRAGKSWPEARLAHYRTRAGAEVDFVLEVGRELWAIEVKASRRIDRPHTTGLRSLADRAKLHRQLVIFTGNRRQKCGDVELVPVEDFLDELPR